MRPPPPLPLPPLSSSFKAIFPTVSFYGVQSVESELVMATTNSSISLFYLKNYHAITRIDKKRGRESMIEKVSRSINSHEIHLDRCCLSVASVWSPFQTNNLDVIKWWEKSTLYHCSENSWNLYIYAHSRYVSEMIKLFKQIVLVSTNCSVKIGEPNGEKFIKRTVVISDANECLSKFNSLQ